jgi:hypothetical protein
MYLFKWIFKFICDAFYCTLFKVIDLFGYLCFFCLVQNNMFYDFYFLFELFKKRLVFFKNIKIRPKFWCLLMAFSLKVK